MRREGSKRERLSQLEVVGQISGEKGRKRAPEVFLGSPESVKY